MRCVVVTSLNQRISNRLFLQVLSYIWTIYGVPKNNQPPLLHYRAHFIDLTSGLIYINTVNVSACATHSPVHTNHKEKASVPFYMCSFCDLTNNPVTGFHYFILHIFTFQSYRQSDEREVKNK